MAETQKLWRVRDIRDELSRRLGVKIDRYQYEVLQRNGLAPKVPEGYRQWDAVWTDEEAEAIILRVVSCTWPTDSARKFRYKRPGVWREIEVRQAIERRVGIEMPRWRWNYCKQIGMFPEPEVRRRRLDGGWTELYDYSDAQVELIITIVESNIDDVKAIECFPDAITA